jgi:molecular chaperone HscB
MNYFELFEIAESPFINNTELNQKYIALQRKFHPDFYTTGTEAEQEDAELQSAAVNKAYSIFKDEHKTMGYFLEQKGLVTTDEKYELPKDFLMEVMELNEMLEEENSNEKLKAFENELAQDITTIQTKTIFTQAELHTIKEFYYKKKYLQRILERLHD